MATDEFLKESLDLFKKQRQAKADELRALDITIRQIQMQLGEPVEAQQADLLYTGGVPEVKASQIAQLPKGVNYKPRLDEFFGQSIAEAALAYLEKIGHAMSAEDILKAITSGGCKVGGADPKRTLSITLGQSKRDFVSTGGGNYGLRKFYNMPKLGRPEGGVSVRRKKSVKRGIKKLARHHGKPRVNVVTPRAYAPAELSAAVSEALSDHKLRTPEEVLKAVEQKIGHLVKKIAVYGTLRKKEFEQVGDKYRLRPVGEGLQVAEVVN